MDPQNQSQIDAKKIFRAGMIVLLVLPVAFLVLILSGNELKIGQTKIWGGFYTNGKILDLVDTPQGISFSSGDVAGEKIGYELESKSMGLRIWNTEFNLFLERWVKADNYIIPQGFVSEQKPLDKFQQKENSEESSSLSDPFR